MTKKVTGKTVVKGSPKNKTGRLVQRGMTGVRGKRGTSAGNKVAK